MTELEIARNARAVLKQRRRDADRERWREKRLAASEWPMPDADLPYRLIRRIEASPDGCWLWRGNVNGEGYGRTTRGSLADGRASVHRLVYEIIVGPIPEDLELDHLCRVRNCCNPEHLEPVTHQVNMLRGETWAAANAGKTHCKYGHELSGDNVKIVANGRGCRPCGERLSAERRARKTPEERKRDAERARATRARKRAEREATT